MKSKFFVTIASAVILLPGTNSLADEQSPRGFFAENYVNQGFSEPSREQVPENVVVEIDQAEPEDPGPGKAQFKSLDDLKSSRKIAPSAAAGPLPESNTRVSNVSTSQHGERILSLGLIVNGTDEAHAKYSIEELIQTAKNFSIALNTVYAVGGMARATEKLPAVEYIWAKTEGAKIKLARIVPKEYPVELSPSWIVETEQGLVVLDGLNSINTVINSQGRFEIAPGTPHSVASPEIQKE